MVYQSAAPLYLPKWHCWNHGHYHIWSIVHLIYTSTHTITNINKMVLAYIPVYLRYSCDIYIYIYVYLFIYYYTYIYILFGQTYSSTEYTMLGQGMVTTPAATAWLWTPPPWLEWPQHWCLGWSKICQGDGDLRHSGWWWLEHETMFPIEKEAMLEPYWVFQHVHT